MAATPTLKRYRLRVTCTLDFSAVGTSGPDALEKWRARGPYANGRPTSEAEMMLAILKPENKALAQPEVTRMRRAR